jgi:hypothetical protein
MITPQSATDARQMQICNSVLICSLPLPYPHGSQRHGRPCRRRGDGAFDLGAEAAAKH